ncbi:MAG TPA: hypothetical protein VFE53_05790 [Mucilaginibacter sp.]|jgi:hypothetical protein|nr:hypothetical protein [Mucilaginibacter sp.]
MKTTITLLLFCCFALVQMAAAQTAATDSTKATPPAKPDSRADRLRAMRDMRPGLPPRSAPFPGEPARDARHNTRQFRLPKELVPKVSSGEIPATSDYFKPTAASTPIPQMLADSAYVKDYRYYAYNKGLRQTAHPATTGLIIGGSVLVLVGGLIALIIVLSHVHIHSTMY